MTVNTIYLNRSPKKQGQGVCLLTCTHDPLHASVLETPLHILQAPDVPVGKHRDSHSLSVGGKRSLPLYHARAVLSQEGQRPVTKFYLVEKPWL